ncbi:MAG: hypothetical protein ABSA94_12695 [Acidobacteriaceae bacterium]
MQIPGLPVLRLALRLVIALSLATIAGSVPTTAHAQAPALADTWHHLAILLPGTRVHISSDKKGRTCFFASVDAATLVCSRRPSSGTHYTFARSEVRTVKLTRYTLSTLAGMGIGAGAGLGIGAAVGHSVETTTNSFFNFTSLGRDVITGLGGAIGFVAGGAIGGPSDFLRGPTLYRRPGL